MPSDPSALAVKVLGDLSRRGARPSIHVMTNGAELIKSEGIKLEHDPVLVYTVAGGKGYVVVLSMNAYGYIKHARCTCEAGRAEKTCKHAVGALIDAYDYGFSLEKLEEESAP